MWFLIKTGFWFSLVLMLLPIFSSQSTVRTQGNPQVQVSDAMTAASGAYSYVTSLCSEKPEVCVKGGQTLTALGYRAREGALVAYELIDHQLSGGAKSPVVGGDKTADAGTAVDNQVASADPEGPAAMQQPMPPKPSASDHVVTGTVKHSFIPVPLPKPVI